MSASLTREAPAKVNLFLRILAREEGGHHGIETLFCRLALADTLTATPADQSGVTLEVSGAETGPEADNLVIRAVRAVLDRSREKPGLHFQLTKRIPVGAGLGGGSADAAAALLLANQLAGNPLPRAELLHLAAALGADVPFCLSGAPLALAWNRGERLLALPPLPSAPVLLLTPPVAVETARAYGWFDESRNPAARRGSLVLDGASLSGWSDVARMAGNDFESVVFGRVPQVRDAFEALARTRPLLCRMTGSGSTLIAIYRTEADRDEALAVLGRKHGSAMATRTA